MRVLKVLSIALGLLLTCNCLADYSGAPIKGWVVDDETGEPLEGVIIVATWDVSVGTLAGTNSGGQIQIMEAVTNQAGEYSFPAWGPKPLPSKRMSIIEDQYIESGEPILELFKNGYQINVVYNRITSEHVTGKVIYSQWDGKTIKLRKFTGTTEEYAANLLQATPEFITQGRNCEWQSTPRFVAAFINESNKIRSKGIKTITLTIGKLQRNTQCANPDIFLKEYGLDSDYLPVKDRPIKFEERHGRNYESGGVAPSGENNNK